MTPRFRSAAVPLAWYDDGHAALAWRHGLALCRALAAEGAAVTACVVTEEAALPDAAARALDRLAGRHGVRVERAADPPVALEGNPYARLAYRFHLWACGRSLDEIHATDLYGLPYYCLLDRRAGRHFTGTAFGLLAIGPSRELLREHGRFPQFDTLGRLHLEDGCLEMADRVRTVLDAALSAADLAPNPGHDATDGPVRILVLGEGLSDAERRFVGKALAQALPRLPRTAAITLADLAPQDDPATPLPGIPVRTADGGEEELPALLGAADVVVLPGTARDAAWLALLGRAAGLPVVGRGHPVLAVLGPGLAPSGPPKDLADRLVDALAAPVPDTVRMDTAPPSLRLDPPGPATHITDAAPVTVSVCMTHFNRPRLLLRALASLAAQDHPVLEVVLVDDGSDQSEALDALDALERDPPMPNLRLIRQNNRYLGAARNAAATAARGTHLLFMDDDNLAKPKELSVLVGAAQASGADIVTCFNDTFSHEGEDGRPVVETRRLFLGPAAGAGVLFNVFGDANALIRAETFRRLGGFTEDYGVGHEDYEFFARAVLAGVRLLTVPEALFWYRVDPGSMIKTTMQGLNHARALRPYLSGGAAPNLADDLAGLARGAFIEADRTVAMLQDDGRRKQEAIEALDAANTEKQGAIAALEAANTEKQGAIAALQAANAEKQAAITALEAANTEKQAAITALEAANTEKQGAITALEAANAALDAANLERQRVIERIMASWSWRITGPFRRMARLARRVTGLFFYRSYPLSLIPGEGLTEAGGVYRSSGDDPQFRLQSTSGRLPRGWTLLSYRGQGFDRPLTPELFLDTGSGLSEAGKLVLPPLREGRITQILRLPAGLHGIRFDPMARPGRFRLDAVEATSCGGMLLLGYLAMRRPRTVLAGLFGGPRRLTSAMDEAIRLENTVPALTYEDWAACFDTLDDDDRAVIRKRAATLSADFTVVVAASTSTVDDIVGVIDSVRAQIHTRWRLVVLAPNRDVRNGLATLLDDPRISVADRITGLAGPDDWVAILDPGARLAPQALFVAAQCLETKPGTDILYADEDRLDARNRRIAPLFKPDWSPDLFLARNYLGPLVIVRGRLLHSGPVSATAAQDPAEDLAYATVLRRMADGPEPVVRHAPFVLSHRVDGTDPQEVARRGRERALLARHLTERGIAARVEPWLDGTANHVVYALPSPAPLVSIIVPTKDKIDLLRLCIDSLRERTAYPSGFEILVIDNRSETDEARAYFTELERSGAARVLAYDAPFNYSAINNFGVRHAKGSVLAFLNNDIETIAPDWLSEMTAHALRPDVGAVGTILYYPDDTIQHAGVGLGLHTLVGHLHRGLTRGSTGYADRAALTQNLSAMTAACLVVRRALFEEIGGFEEEHLHVAFNDVDLCLRLRAAGYRLVWTPHAEMYHHEGASRGRVERPERLAQFAVEIAYMMERWAPVVAADPYYSPNLTLDAEDCGLAWPPRVIPPWRQPAAAEETGTAIRRMAPTLPPWPNAATQP